MDAAEFDRTDEHHGLGIRLRDCLGYPESIDHCVTAHKPDVGSLGCWLQSKRFEECVVQTRCAKSCAGNGDQMRYSGCIQAGLLEG